ncbi:hypothetical protein [Myxosarcina sp. GI1(2024)]
MSNQEPLFAEINPSEEANLSGGRRRGRPPGVNLAFADATADAIGLNTFTQTFTDAFVVEGVRSSSTSSSIASAAG